MYRILIALWALMFVWIFSIGVVHAKVVYFTTNTPIAFTIFSGILVINLVLIILYRRSITRRQFIDDIRHFGVTLFEVMITAFMLSSLFIVYASWYARVAFLLTGFVGVLLLERIKSRFGK